MQDFNKILSVILSFFTLHFSQNSVAQDVANEPAYCKPSVFQSYEVSESTQGLERAHIYRFGNFNLVGLAVGNSETQAVKNFAEKFSHYSSDEKFCTWYFNDGNDAAGEAFRQYPLSNPAFSSEASLVKEYSSALDSSFDGGPSNFISCAQKHKYLAMGCDGMKHRGPSVFAMLLSFSGCSPESSVALVEKVWGKNFVGTSKRLALAQKAYEMGSARPESRRALQSIFAP